MRHRRVGRLLFQGNIGVGFRAVKVFEKKYARPAVKSKMKKKKQKYFCFL
jgi:hypothetical protein